MKDSTCLRGRLQYLFNQAAHSGSDPYERHLKGVQEEIKQLQSEGLAILGTEVPATVAGLSCGRRYDVVVQNPESLTIFGVEVKTSLTGMFRLDPQQVEFDVRTVQRGAISDVGNITGGCIVESVSAVVQTLLGGRGR